MNERGRLIQHVTIIPLILLRLRSPRSLFQVSTVLLTSRPDAMACRCMSLAVIDMLVNCTPILMNFPTLSPAKHPYMITRPPPYFPVETTRSGTICSAFLHLTVTAVNTIILKFSVFRPTDAFPSATEFEYYY